MNISSVALGGKGGGTSWASNISSELTAPQGPELGGGDAPSAASLTSRLFKPDKAKANYARDLLAIVTFALNLDIPHVNFNGEEGVLQRLQPWLIRPERLVHLLGSGATCTVSLHEPAEEISEAVTAAKLVVLKRYHEPRGLEAEHERKAHQRLHSLMWQDLRVLTHPYLKNHENIVKLLYLAWQEESLIPVFALEFAQYGTLDEFQKQNADTINLKQKLDLSIDIATGIAALHNSDFVHSDIKPSNILICKHQERGVVARISDFVGAAHAVEFGSVEHIRFETEEWVSPEVFQRNAHIDWKKADVYSVGLVLAHLWYPPDVAGSCFLHHLISLSQPRFPDFSRDQQMFLIRGFKINCSSAEREGGEHVLATIIGDLNQIDWALVSERNRAAGLAEGGPEETSVSKDQGVHLADTSLPGVGSGVECVQSADEVSTVPREADAPSTKDDLRDDQAEFQPVGIIKRCLNASLKFDQSQRCTTPELLRLMYNEIVNWRGQYDDAKNFTPSEACQSEIAELPTKSSLLGRELHIDVNIGSSQELPRAQPSFHRAVVVYLMQSLDTTMQIPQCFLPDLDEADTEDDLSVLKWFYANNVEAEHALGPDVQAYAYWWTLGQLHLLGMGLLTDDQRAVDAITKAAQGAMATAMAVLPRIVASSHAVKRESSDDRPMLWLSYSMRNGYLDGMDQMRQDYPQLYRTTRRILVGRLLFSHQVETLLFHLGRTTLDFYRALISDSKIMMEASSLMYQSASPFSITPFHVTALHAAAGFADVEVLSWLLTTIERFEIETEDIYGRTPAWFAVESEHPDALHLLLAHGANSGHVDGEGQSLLHRTASLEDSTACAMARLLLDKGAKLNAMAAESFDDDMTVNVKFSRAVGTPLVWAVYRNRSKLFTLLLLEHYSTDIAIEREIWMFILQRISIYHQVDMLETILALERSSSQNPSPQELFKNKVMPGIMLRLAVHEHSHHLLGCRMQLGAEFYPRQAKFIERVISLGGDPLSSFQSQGSAMSYALSQGDRQAVELFFGHLEAREVDPYKILLTDGEPTAQYGFSSLVKARCIDAFLWALQRYPKLARLSLKGQLGSTLHLSILLGQAEHVRALLEAGADRYSVQESIDATALEIAIEAQKLDVANVLIEGADVLRLLGSPSEYGNTLFGRLLNRTFSIRKRIKIDTFRWLKEHDAIQFYPNVVTTDMSLWRLFFSQRFVARRDTIDEDLQLLHFLTQPDTFLDKIHQTDGTGMAAIHYAARWGNYESVKMLIDKGAHINQEVAYSRNSYLRAPPTATALEFATIVAMSVPDHVKSGGAFVIKLWKEDCKNKLNFIQEKGGMRGEYQRLLDRAMYGSEWFDPSSQVQRYGSFLSHIGKLDEMQGQWPAKLPTALSTLALGKNQEADAKTDQELSSALKRLNIDANIVDLFESEEMKELARRVRDGKGTEDELFELLAHARKSMNADGQGESSRRGFSIEPSSHPGDAREEHDEGHKQEAEQQQEVQISELADEDVEAEISTAPAEITNEGMERYMGLLQQPRFREYFVAKVKVMREHGVDVEKGF